MATLKDIAAEAGVSITTVSNVVHNRTSRVSTEQISKIWAIMEREHYIPNMTARSLASEQSAIIGVITHITPKNSGSTISDPFLSSIIASIEQRVREKDYYLMFRAVEDFEKLSSLVRSWHLSGLILLGMFQDPFFEAVQHLDVPFVLIDSYVNDSNVCCIGLQDEEGGYLATRHLLENGHRVIAFASPSIQPGGVVEQRFYGYQRALGEFGLSFDPSMVFNREMNVQDGKELGRVLSQRTEITGIVTSADILAAGIMAGLSEKQVRVPENKSIVGFDDLYLSQLTSPGLTTIHQDAARKGELAVDMILSQLHQQAIPKKKVILPVSLVKRGSVRNLLESKSPLG